MLQFQQHNGRTPIKPNKEHRRKYQKTGNPIHKLHHNLLTTQIQKKITDLRNKNWWDKLENMKTTNHMLWQTRSRVRKTTKYQKTAK